MPQLVVFEILHAVLLFFADTVELSSAVVALQPPIHSVAAVGAFIDPDLIIHADNYAIKKPWSKNQGFYPVPTDQDADSLNPTAVPVALFNWNPVATTLAAAKNAASDTNAP